MEAHLILAIEDNKYEFSKDIWNWNGVNWVLDKTKEYN